MARLSTLSPPAPFCLLFCLLLGPLGCAAESESAEFVAPMRDFRDFQTQVYPVLLRDCGFPTCHGSQERLFRVWGPGRARLQRENGMGILEEALPFEAPLGVEISTSFANAKAMVDPFDAAQSLLLRKPLSVGAGGAGHEGVDRYGRDVYRTMNDSGYRVIEAWVSDVPEPPPDMTASGGMMPTP